MALVFQRHNSPMITIPYEFLCMKRPRLDLVVNDLHRIVIVFLFIFRANVAYFPTSKVFTFDDIVSLPVSMTTGNENLKFKTLLFYLFLSHE